MRSRSAVRDSASADALAADAPHSLNNANASGVLKVSLLGPTDVSAAATVVEVAAVEAAADEPATAFPDTALGEELAWRLRGKLAALDLGEALG
jgi:hypothetical protein